MAPVGDGWHELLTDKARPGSYYRFVLPDGKALPDPASCFQPEDVSGPSEVVDFNRYQWRQTTWKGRPWTDAIIYELHVGAFSTEGNFLGVIEKLPYLARLGITAVQLMPVSDFHGAFSWGYDGVMPYAPDSTYGRPEQLMALIDMAHSLDLMVFLDVVYNHFGPKGNYLSSFAPDFFTTRRQTPWGMGINFDGEASTPVRQFFIDNALHWLEAYRFDGLRFDAIHAIADDSDQHLIDSIATVIRERSPQRQIHLIAENENNEAQRLRRKNGQPLLLTAQWNDDVHHVLHVAGTGERAGYYEDYYGDNTKLARALAEGFAFQGEVMPYRGSARGQPSASLPPVAFVSFLQNHDQIGNRAFGERINSIAPADAVYALQAVIALLPHIPMIFMGEEWGARSPFPFFCDFSDDLADAVRTGRRDEFAKFPEFADPMLRERIPDPINSATFMSAKLQWNTTNEAAQRTMIDRYKVLFALRQREIIPRLSRIVCGGEYSVTPSGAVQIQWRAGQHECLTLLANLSAAPASYRNLSFGHVIWQEGEWDESVLSPWFVQWSIRHNELDLRGVE